MPIPDYNDVTIHQVREMTTPLFESYIGSEAVERSDHVVDAEHGVTIRAHRPVDRDGALPCLVWLHGGGFVTGSYLMDGPRLEGLATRLDAVVISVDYRLAPEVPFPGPLEDCHAALQWVFDNAESLAIDTDRIGIGGLSAGGGLTAALALLARDKGGDTPCFQLLEAPMLDDQLRSESIRRDDLQIWSQASNRYGWQAYLGELYGTETVSYHAAPARCPDLSGLPPTMVILGTADGLRDEGITYASQLMRSGVPTELHVLPGVPHGGTMFIGPRVTARWEQLIEEWLAAQFTTPANGLP
jgi:acetyl esterase/lipase